MTLASAGTDSIALIPDLKDRVVLITGASTGIGAAAARAFGRNGARVAINFRSSQSQAEGVGEAVRQQGGQAGPVQAQGTGGSIVNLSSIAARHGGGPGSVLYAATKGFVATATRGWAKELVNDRIRVNAVSPGVIMTPFHERYSTAEQLAAMQATIPMGRLGLAEECAGAFLYLVSDQMSGYVTGQVIEVNGGQYMP